MGRRRHDAAPARAAARMSPSPEDPGAFPTFLFKAALVLVALALVFALLVLGQSLIVPLVLALGLLVLINATAERLQPPGHMLPFGLRAGAAVLLYGGVILLVGFAVGQAVAGVVESAPRYQAAFGRASDALMGPLGFDLQAVLREATARADVGALVRMAVSTVTEIAGTLGLVVVFLLFLLLEQRSFPAKLAAMTGSPEHTARAAAIVRRINGQITAYVVTKALLAAVMGLACYLTLSLAGVEHAAFWGFLTFLLDFIPTIGSLGGVLLAVLATLAQFEDPVPALVVGALLTLIQTVQGNIVEPRMMSRSLNLSPLAVILSLAVWGIVWGPIGLFLGVPLTAALAIVFGAFPATRPVAIALSDDGGGAGPAAGGPSL